MYLYSVHFFQVSHFQLYFHCIYICTEKCPLLVNILKGLTELKNLPTAVCILCIPKLGDVCWSSEFMRKVANAQYHDFGCGVSVVGLQNEDNFYLKMIRWKGFFFWNEGMRTGWPIVLKPSLFLAFKPLYPALYNTSQMIRFEDSVFWNSWEVSYEAS